jgi:membrane protein DedA with SNARE-associated domain
MMLRTLALLPIFVLLSGEQALVLFAPLPLTILLMESVASRRVAPRMALA